MKCSRNFQIQAQSRIPKCTWGLHGDRCVALRQRYACIASSSRVKHDLSHTAAQIVQSPCARLLKLKQAAGSCRRFMREIKRSKTGNHLLKLHQYQPPANTQLPSDRRSDLPPLWEGEDEPGGSVPPPLAQQRLGVSQPHQARTDLKSGAPLRWQMNRGRKCAEQ